MYIITEEKLNILINLLVEQRVYIDVDRFFVKLRKDTSISDTMEPVQIDQYFKMDDPHVLPDESTQEEARRFARLSGSYKSFHIDLLQPVSDSYDVPGACTAIWRSKLHSYKAPRFLKSDVMSVVEGIQDTLWRICVAPNHADLLDLMKELLNCGFDTMLVGIPETTYRIGGRQEELGTATGLFGGADPVLA